MNQQAPNPRSKWFVACDGLILFLLLIVSLVPIGFSFYVQGQMVDRIDHQLSSAISPDLVLVSREMSRHRSEPNPRD